MNTSLPAFQNLFFSLGEKDFPKPLTVYDSQQVAREYPYAYSFLFSAKAARGAGAREFHFKKEKLYLNYSSCLLQSCFKLRETQTT